ncbi:MAG: hypothetical protein AB8H79_24325 [Myxococcota bacterium]
MTTRAWICILAMGLSGCGLGWSTFTDASDDSDHSDHSDDGGVPLDCPLDACFGDCTDLDNDPENCGSCGRTCVIFRGAPSCVLGECALDVCDLGFADCDDDPINGCEAEVDCDATETCATTCGSEGTVDCTDECAPTCQAPDEACNVRDDNCDGQCDEGAIPGCRQSIYRSSGGLGHVYGTDSSEAGRLGQKLESAEYFFLYAQEGPELRALFRCDKGGGRRFLTTSTNCEIGRAPEATLGYIAPTQACGSTPLYRLYSGAARNHFYTTSAPERDRAVAEYGYRFERIVGYVWSQR